MKKSELRQIIKEEIQYLMERKWTADDSVGGDEQDLTSSEILSKSKFFPAIQPGDEIFFKINNIKYKNGICLGFDKSGQPGRTMFVELPNKKYTLIDALIDGKYITNVKRNGKSVQSGVKIKEGFEVSTRKFEFSHGRKPKGDGGWIFKIGSKEWAAPGRLMYGQAVKAAKAHAKKVGATQIEVMP